MNGLRVDESMQDEQGSVVGGVAADAPADLAGFKIGDLVSSFNSLPILSGEDLFNALQGMTAGQPFQATLQRDGEIVHVKGELGVQTTAHTCRPADAQLLETAIAADDLPSFKLVISAPNWRFTARCLNGCVWGEVGLSEFGPDPRPSIVLDQEDLHLGYPEQ